MIEKERIRLLNSEKIKLNGCCVIYWMQADQRAEYNHGLEYAILRANELKKPVMVMFVLCDKYPGANLRHYDFMLRGLHETAQALKKRGIGFWLKKGEPAAEIIEAGRNACLVVTDRGYTRIQKKWRKLAAKGLKCPLYEIESNCVVPVETVTPKEEYSAATIRGKILREVFRFLRPLKNHKPIYGTISPERIFDPDQILAGLDIDRTVKPVKSIRPGLKEAKKKLKKFLAGPVRRYAAERSDPSLNCESGMSPYLHFGQISVVYIALEALKAGQRINGTFLENLIIRRELALNFVHYNKKYDSFSCLPAWAKKTLIDHENDRRPYVYTLNQLENAQTHDPYWNAAQMQMVKTGKMHNYMRMYWGKKVLEWSASCKKAFKILVYLNDKYELDGRDPNGYAGIAWCFGKHDRAWTEREIFGKIRYMNSSGLERKFDIWKYVRQVNDE